MSAQRTIKIYSSLTCLPKWAALLLVLPVLEMFNNHLAPILPPSLETGHFHCVTLISSLSHIVNLSRICIHFHFPSLLFYSLVLPSVTKLLLWYTNHPSVCIHFNVNQSLSNHLSYAASKWLPFIINPTLILADKLPS